MRRCRPNCLPLKSNQVTHAVASSSPAAPWMDATHHGTHKADGFFCTVFALLGLEQNFSRLKLSKIGDE